MAGPYRCFLCELEDETMEHLLDTCKFVSSIWDSGADIFHHFDLVRQNPTSTLFACCLHGLANPFKIPFNRLWEILPHFFL